MKRSLYKNLQVKMQFVVTDLTFPRKCRSLKFASKPSCKFMCSIVVFCCTFFILVGVNKFSNEFTFFNIFALYFHFNEPLLSSRAFYKSLKCSDVVNTKAAKYISASLLPNVTSAHMLGTWHCCYLVAWCRTWRFLEMRDIEVLLEVLKVTWS